MKKSVYVNKNNGKEISPSAKVLKLLGQGFLKEWALKNEIPSEVVAVKSARKIEPETPFQHEIPIEQEVPIEVEEERMTLKEITAVIDDMSDEEVNELLDDERVTVKRLAEKEIEKRHGDRE